ncbi:MAG: hypothetical protein IJI46_06450 [Erysipelotrichaceae bacterium]|nr:hypothetical protein [Erysipelotrichaceae bacterium]
MKALKIIINTLLSLLLIAALLCAVLSFTTSRLFARDQLSSLIDKLPAGEKILQYEHLPQEEKESDFYDVLADTIPVQVALAVNISSDNAKTCQEGAFAYVKEKQDEKYVYSDLNDLADDLCDAYVETAIKEKIINPKEYFTYMNVNRERVRTTKGALLEETMRQKYRTVIGELKDQDFFCSLDIDNQNTFAYVLKEGSSAAKMQNGLYELLEKQADDKFNEAFMNYISCLAGENKEDIAIEKESYIKEVSDSVYSYLEDQGLSLNLLDKEKADKVISQSAKDYLYPKLSAYLPSYANTLSSVPAPLLSLLKLALNGKLFYITAGICAVLALLIILIGKKTSLPFIGLSLLLSGAFIFFSKTQNTKAADNLTTLVQNANNPLSFIVEDLVNAFMTAFSSSGIYLAIAGLIFLVLAFLFRNKKTAKAQL